MNEELEKKLEAAIASCAEKIAKVDTTASDALQYAQAAAYTSNVLDELTRRKPPTTK